MSSSVMEENKTNKPDKNPVYPYSVPEGYFEELKANVFRRIQEEAVIAEPEVKPKHWYQRVAPYLYVAAAILGLALVIRFVPTSEESVYMTSLDEVTPELYEQFLMEETADDYWGVVLLDDGEGEETPLVSSNL